MKKFLLLLTCALCVVAFAHDHNHNHGKKAPVVAAPAKTAPAPAAAEENLPSSPLRLKGYDKPEIDLGKVFALNRRLFTVIIENPSDKPVEYTSIILNCNCTTIFNAKEVKPQGTIAPKGQLKLVLSMNGPDLKVKNRFFRQLRLTLKDYAPFRIALNGTISREIFMTFDDDPEQKPRTAVTVGYISDPEKHWETILHIRSTLPKDQPLELGKVVTSKNFVAALRRHSDHHWSVQIIGAKPMSIGPLVNEAVVIQVLSPIRKGEQEIMAFPIMGICGTKLTTSTDVVFQDPKADPKVVTKRFAITREPFMDKIAIASAVLGKPNPYQPQISILKVDEVTVTPVKGVTVKLEQGKGGVYAICTMDRSKMTEKGEFMTISAPKAKSVQARFAILGEKERAAIAEEAARRAKKAAEEAAAEAEQEKIK